MDYAIYKTLNGQYPHIVHRFSQDACNHRAKATAQAKLNDMWLRILQRPAFAMGATGTKDEFSYDCAFSADTTMRIRFYIAPIK